MADTVGEFLIKLGLDANGLDKQLNSVVGNVKSGLSNLMSGVVGPALAGLAGAGFVQSFADEITQVSSLSDALGVNIETLSAWRTAAEMAGVEADEVGEIFADFNDWMVDAKFNEGGAMYTDFISNGLLPAVTDANGEMKKTEDYILEFADALHNMDQAQASGIARQIGVSDLKTATWLQQGGDAIRRQLELAKEIGTFTEEDALAAKEYSMSVTVLTHSIKMGLLPIFRAIVPTLTNIAKGFKELVKQVEPSISSFGKMLGDVFTQASSVVGSALKILADNIIAIAPLLAGLGVMKLVSVFKNMAGAIKTASIAAKAFLSPWGIVLTSLVAIGFAIQDFMKWLNGGDSVLSGFFEALFGDTENAKNILDNVYNGFMDIVSKFEDNFSQLIPRFEELGQALLNLFNKIVDSEGFSLFVGVIISVIGFITTAIASFVNFLADNSNEIASIVDFIIGIFIGIVDVITYVVEAINSGITSAIEIFNTLGTVIEQIGNTISSIFNALSVAVMPFIDVLNNLYTVCNEVVNFIAELVGYLVDTISGGISSIINLLYSLMDVVTSVGGFISGIFNSMASAFSSFVSSVISGASSVIGSIQGILNKLAELASNSLFGKILGSVGGSIYGAISRINNTDNSSTVNTSNSNNTTNTYNYYGNGSGLGIDFRQGDLGY